MKFSLLNSLGLTLLPCAALALDISNANGTDSRVCDIISRDVCVIGGGSSGTYAAIRLREEGKSVVVIEKTGRLGGHTDTYTDPVTGVKVDYGVVVFHNETLVRDYFARFNISMVAAALDGTVPVTTLYYDLRTGTLSSYVPGDPSAGLAAYGAELAKYPYVETGFDLPDPVPQDLLLPFGDFAQKYSAIQSAVPLIFSFAQGLGDLLAQPTLYVFKNFGSDILQMLATNGFIVTAVHDNSLLYERAAVSLGPDVLFNSAIIAMQRGDDTAQIDIKTNAGTVQANCEKVLVTIPPKLNNLNGFDLSPEELQLFGQFGNSGYYTGLIRNSGIPNNVSVQNHGDDTPYNLTPLPGPYAFSYTASPDLLDVKYGSNTSLSDDFVKADILQSLERIQLPGKDTSAVPEFAAFASHTPFELTVSAEAISNGFYRDLYALQGQRGTYYTGAAFHTHDSSLLWQFTEALLPLIVA
ncbi:flavin-containing superfamily Amine oxidase [Phlyctema vagabunda]|uniref:Flavin-containing superfamily Amine oxidase n=1 Tax=Phlyctema vagabunda TaxID=108571 RepID=A0ABR4PL63_9HELO